MLTRGRCIRVTHNGDCIAPLTLGLRAAPATAQIINDFSTAARLDRAIEDCRRERDRLDTTIRHTRVLVDAYNTELRTYVSDESTGSVKDAQVRLSASAHRGKVRGQT